MSKHTPGPWTAQGIKDSYSVTAPSGLADRYVGKYIARVDRACVGYQPLSAAEQTANARLIAAAPELLAAAQKALDFIHSLPYEPSIAPSTKAQDALVDAIAKARGEG